MNPTVYACSGSCHGVASQEQHDKGATVCGADSCERKGQPLEAHIQCDACNAAAADGGGHCCSACIRKFDGNFKA